jgi:hypothetical protein
MNNPLTKQGSSNLRKGLINWNPKGHALKRVMVNRPRPFTFKIDTVLSVGFHSTHQNSKAF